LNIIYNNIFYHNYNNYILKKHIYIFYNIIYNIYINRQSKLNILSVRKKRRSTQNGRGLWRENCAISWIQSPSYKHKPHQSHGLAMDTQSEQGSEPEKKESNGQTPQTQQTEERAHI